MKKKAPLITIVFCLLALCQIGFAQSVVEFVENKGQWDSKINFKGLMVNGAFALQKTGYRVVLHDNKDLNAIADYYHGHVHEQASAAKALPNANTHINLHSHAYEMKFLNANENPTIIPEKPINTYNNYFIDKDPSKWASNCKIYTAITYKNIYPNIDVRYYTDNGRLKYDIIVQPGGDASKIVMYFDGVDALKVKDGELVIKTSVQELREMAPTTYQLATTGKKDIPCSYKVKGNFVQFNLPDNLSKQEVLVIDPTLVFCTFTGSIADNWGFTATYDAAGNFYAGGIVFGPGFPVSNGAYQTSFQGGTGPENIGAFDIGIMKFDPTGANRIYATYLGGSSSAEQPHSLIVDANNNLIIAGRTASNNFPTTAPNFGPGGGWDIFIAKLNSSGTGLLAARKFGGSGADGVNIAPKYVQQGATSIRRNYGDDARSEVILDNQGNICLASSTQSTDFLTTPGAAQTTPGAANGNLYQDAVVIKATADLSNVIFSTLFGGNGDDAAFVLSVHPTNGNIYVAGGTTSTNLPGNTAGTVSPNNNGTGGDSNIDGFVTILSPTGTSIVKTTYIGTTGRDLVFGIQFDKFGFPYVMGTSTGSMPVTSGVWSQAGGKQFVGKLQQDLSAWVFSTVFGTNTSFPNISPVAFLVDRCENMYISGWGGGINVASSQGGQGYENSGVQGMFTTPDAIKVSADVTNNGGGPTGNDMYFFVLERNAGQPLYGTFFGQNGGLGEHVDGGTSRFDKNGVIYQSICANCGRDVSFPTTPGVWSQNNGSNNCNLAAVKIAFNLSGVGSQVQTSINGVDKDTSGCVPLTVDFIDIYGQGKRYIWNFGDGSPDVSTTSPNISHTYNNIGSYRVRLVSIDSATCNVADTSYATVRVRNDDAILGISAAKQPPCSALNYNFINNSIPPGNKPFKATSFRWDFGDGTTLIAGTQTVNHTYAAPGTYRVRLYLVDTNYCNEPDSAVLVLRVAPLVKAQFKTDSSGCVPYNAFFENTSLAGTTFIWDFGDGSPVSNQSSPTHTYNTTGTFRVKLIAIDSSTCNIIDSTSMLLVVSPNPSAAFTFAPNPPQVNTAVTFTNNSSGGTLYNWKFGDGDSVLTSNYNALVSHIYNETKLFNACLIVINPYNCRDTSCQTLQALVAPLIDVPNAFSPNNDGINDIIYINGYGIKSINWNIYNRWGSLIFNSTSKSIGWNGTFKGVIQPQDVYTYTLQIEFSDGTTTTKKGDITLLR